jgi:peptidoglycan endopeptidase LytF
MSRRDIIIVAVLLNAAVLSFLFLTATRPEEEQSYRPKIESFIALDSVGVAPEQLHSEVVVLESVPRDEVDAVLKPYLSASHEPAKQTPIPTVPHLVQMEDQDAVVIAPIETPTATAEESVLEVVVKRGDVLEKIARANGTTVKEIKRLNHLTNDRISIGQVLRIPKESKAADAFKPLTKLVFKETPKTTKTASREVTSSDAQFYTVQPGDNPWKIARQNKVQLEDLLKLNGLTEETARNLKVGDKLRVH